MLRSALTTVAVALALAAGARAGDSPSGGDMRVLSWNILYGADSGHGRNRWPERKVALKAALERERPDILCVQEARPGQLRYLDGLLPDHDRVGVGRDDGKSAGEFCAIFFSRKRFRLIDSGTFWLSDTPGKPSRTWKNEYYRICTWVRLEDPATKRAFRVYNTHFPLIPEARAKSAALILKRIAAARPADPVVLTGDFNCQPGSRPWKAITDAGFRDSESASGAKTSTPTYHRGGVIDAVFLKGGWKVGEHRVVDSHAKGVYPSDHFGVAAVVTPAQGRQERPRHAAAKKATEAAVQEALPGWDAKLLAMLKARLAAGKKPRFRLESMRATMRVTKVGDDGALRLSSGPITTRMAFSRLTLAEKKSLALAVADVGRPGDCAVAAFYLLAAGEEKNARNFLRAAGDEAAEVRAIFE